MKDLDLHYPALSDLRKLAKRRLPDFAFEFLDSGTGRETGVEHNRTALDRIRFMPAILKGVDGAELSQSFMGEEYRLPVGIAPVGMSGMIWPGAERKLATAAVQNRIPYCMSMMATTPPEVIAPFIGDSGWFQLYPPDDQDIRRDIIKRAKDAGFRKLVMTVDVPGESRRERQRRAHLSLPPKITVSMIISMILHPAWTLSMAREGRPSMKLADSYVPDVDTSEDGFSHAGRVLRGAPDWDYLKAVRDEWAGDLLIKGVLEPEDAERLVDAGVDGLWVSNHSARQFEACPASIEQLPKVRQAVGDAVPIAFDSGVIGGLDVMRAIALGADFVFLGRAFHFAVAALGERGIDHLLHILEADMQANMMQIGVSSLDELHTRLVGHDALRDGHANG